MKKQELIQLKKAYLKELNSKVIKINELLKDKNNKELAKLYYLDDSVSLDSIESMVIREIIEDFHPSETNGIYVCTRGLYNEIKPGCSRYSTIIVDPEDERVEERNYIDIEDERNCTDYVDEEYKSDFERRHIVLNPYNTYQCDNKFDRVREEFFMYSCKYGQSEAKKLLLQKYTRM